MKFAVCFMDYTNNEPIMEFVEATSLYDACMEHSKMKENTNLPPVDPEIGVYHDERYGLIGYDDIMIQAKEIPNGT